MQRLVTFLMTCVMIVSFSITALAATEQGSAKKLARGTRNVLLGWTELPKGIIDTTRQSNALVGLTIGTLKGIGQVFARTVSGAVEVVTFPIGRYDRPTVKPAMVPENTK